jgi:hypothetical protein
VYTHPLCTYILSSVDYIQAHEILPLRGVLKTRFPTKINGAIGPDTTALLTKFLAGVNLKIKPNLANQQHGTCDLLIGRVIFNFSSGGL